MRILTIIALTANATNMAYAEPGDTTRYRDPEVWHWVPSIGMVFNDQNMIDATLLIAKYEGGGPCTGSDYVAYRAGVEYYDAKPAPIIAPKLGVEGDYLIFAMRLA